MPSKLGQGNLAQDKVACTKLRSQPARTVYLVKRAETVVRNGLESCLHPLGVTPRQYITLSLLREERDQSSADLARKAGITPQSMSETIAMLIGKGLIDRLETPGRRRILMTRLTEAGETLLDACDSEVDELEAKLLSGIPDEDLDVLRRSLRAMVRAG